MIQKKYDKWGHNKPWRKLYNNATWKNLRQIVFHRDPICKICNRRPSSVADHIKDHKGNLKLFYDLENLRGLCKPCHDKKTGETSHGNSPEDKAPKSTIVGDDILDAALERYQKARGNS